MRFFLAAILLAGCVGCAPFQPLPPGDPIWIATTGGSNPFVIDPSRPDRFPKASTDQRSATERAKIYIGRLLPAESLAFVDNLERENFRCAIYGGGVGWECIYSEAHPPSVCAASMRVSIELNFPYNAGKPAMISKDEIDVAALVTPDFAHVDERGCFPM